MKCFYYEESRTMNKNQPEDKQQWKESTKDARLIMFSDSRRDLGLLLLNSDSSNANEARPASSSIRWDQDAGFR